MIGWGGLKMRVVTGRSGQRETQVILVLLDNTQRQLGYVKGDMADDVE